MQAAEAVAAVVDTDDVINAVLYTDCAVGRRTTNRTRENGALRRKKHGELTTQWVRAGICKCDFRKSTVLAVFEKITIGFCYFIHSGHTSSCQTINK